MLPGEEQPIQLLQMLDLLDQQSSVSKPAPMAMVYAVLASSLMVDMIASHRHELQGILMQKQATSDDPKSSQDGAKSKHKGSKHKTKAPMPPVMSLAVQQWQESMPLQATAESQEPDARAGSLFDCLASATVEYLHNQMLAGMMTNANESATLRLLRDAWDSKSTSVQVRLASGCLSVLGGCRGREGGEGRGQAHCLHAGQLACLSGNS